MDPLHSKPVQSVVQDFDSLDPVVTLPSSRRPPAIRDLPSFGSVEGELGSIGRTAFGRDGEELASPVEGCDVSLITSAMHPLDFAGRCIRFAFALLLAIVDTGVSLWFFNDVQTHYLRMYNEVGRLILVFVSFGCLRLVCAVFLSDLMVRFLYRNCLMLRFSDVYDTNSFFHIALILRLNAVAMTAILQDSGMIASGIIFYAYTHAPAMSATISLAVSSFSLASTLGVIAFYTCTDCCSFCLNDPDDSSRAGDGPLKDEAAAPAGPFRLSSVGSPLLCPTAQDALPAGLDGAAAAAAQGSGPRPHPYGPYRGGQSAAPRGAVCVDVSDPSGVAVRHAGAARAPRHVRLQLRGREVLPTDEADGDDYDDTDADTLADGGYGADGGDGGDGGGAHAAAEQADGAAAPDAALFISPLDGAGDAAAAPPHHLPHTGAARGGPQTTPPEGTGHPLSPPGGAHHAGGYRGSRVTPPRFMGDMSGEPLQPTTRPPPNRATPEPPTGRWARSPAHVPAPPTSSGSAHGPDGAGLATHVAIYPGAHTPPLGPLSGSVRDRPYSAERRESTGSAGGGPTSASATPADPRFVTVPPSAAALEGIDLPTGGAAGLALPRDVRGGSIGHPGHPDASGGPSHVTAHRGAAEATSLPLSHSGALYGKADPSAPPTTPPAARGPVDLSWSSETTHPSAAAPTPPRSALFQTPPRGAVAAHVPVPHPTPRAAAFVSALANATAHDGASGVTPAGTAGQASVGAHPHRSPAVGGGGALAFEPAYSQLPSGPLAAMFASGHAGLDGSGKDAYPSGRILQGSGGITATGSAPTLGSLRASYTAMLATSSLPPSIVPSPTTAAAGGFPRPPEIVRVHLPTPRTSVPLSSPPTPVPFPQLTAATATASASGAAGDSARHTPTGDVTGQVFPEPHGPFGLGRYDSADSPLGPPSVPSTPTSP